MVDGDRSWASGAYESLAPAHRAELLRIAAKEEDREPVPVPTTAIYSRTDGIVRWHTCIDTVSPRHENVEVRGSHSGLGHNPTVLAVIADRLAQPEGRWRPFKPAPWAAVWYPKPGGLGADGVLGELGEVFGHDPAEGHEAVAPVRLEALEEGGDVSRDGLGLE